MSTGYGTTTSHEDMGNHWLLRIVAAIIDGIPWSIIVYIIWWAIALNPGSPLWGAWIWWGSWLVIPLLVGVFWVVYSSVMESSSGASFGKKVLGLRVQMLDGSKVSFDKAFTRNISKIFWPILLIDWLIGVATPGPDPRQRYFDRIAGTTVVSTKQPFTSAVPPPPPPPS